MKTVLLDAGNTAVKWRIVSPDGPWSDADPRGTIPVGTPRLAEELQDACKAAGCSLSDAAGCCVAPQSVQDTIDGATIAALGRPVRWLTAATRFEAPGISLRNGYRDPMQLGADRWHALIGARAVRPRGTLLVVSAGTATTVDTLTDDGRFVGGVIAPGIRLMHDSLARGTARLPRADGAYRPHPDNTGDAMQTGIIDAQIGLIERRIGRIRVDRAAASVRGDDADDRAIHVLLSGGNAELLYKAWADAQTCDPAATAVVRSVEPDLVLRGLRLRSTREPPT